MLQQDKNAERTIQEGRTQRKEGQLDMQAQVTSALIVGIKPMDLHLCCTSEDPTLVPTRDVQNGRQDKTDYENSDSCVSVEKRLPPTPPP